MFQYLLRRNVHAFYKLLLNMLEEMLMLKQNLMHSIKDRYIMKNGQKNKYQIFFNLKNIPLKKYYGNLTSILTDM